MVSVASEVPSLVSVILARKRQLHYDLSPCREFRHYPPAPRPAEKHQGKKRVPQKLPLPGTASCVFSWGNSFWARVLRASIGLLRKPSAWMGAPGWTRKYSSAPFDL